MGRDVLREWGKMFYGYGRICFEGMGGDVLRVWGEDVLRLWGKMF